MPDEVESPLPEFQPGWPDILPMGLVTGQIFLRGGHPGELADATADVVVEWKISPGLAPAGIAFIGDLTVYNLEGFAGIITLMPLALRDCPDDPTVEYANEIVGQYGEWASTLLYDYAAAQLRAALSGSGLDLELPLQTPEVELMQLEVPDDIDS